MIKFLKKLFCTRKEVHVTLYLQDDKNELEIVGLGINYRTKAGEIKQFTHNLYKSKHLRSYDTLEAHWSVQYIGKEL